MIWRPQGNVNRFNIPRAMNSDYQISLKHVEITANAEAMLLSVRSLRVRLRIVVYAKSAIWQQAEINLQSFYHPISQCLLRTRCKKSIFPLAKTGSHAEGWRMGLGNETCEARWNWTS